MGEYSLVLVTAESAEEGVATVNVAIKHIARALRAIASIDSSMLLCKCDACLRPIHFGASALVS